MTEGVPLLIADIYESAGRLRSSGEVIASSERQTQARWQALSVASEEELTVPQAARRLGISRQALQRTVNELRDDGLMQLVDNPDHRTSPRIAVTGDGRMALGALTSHAHDFHRGLEGVLTPSEVNQVRATLRKLNLYLSRGGP
jgi:DNA-binding MarR family transcriptional regulator